MVQTQLPQHLEAGSEAPPAAPRILITLLGSIGDVARGLTLVPRLKSHWPECRITWLVEPKSEGLVRLCGQLNRVIVFRRGSGWSALQETLRELRSEQYDLALDLQRHLKSGLFTWLSRCPRRIGFARPNTKEGNWLFCTETISAFPDGETNKGEAYHRFLDRIGVPRRGDNFSLSLSYAASTRRPYVVFVMGSSWNSKNWFAAGYASLARRILAETDFDVLLIGDGSQAHSAAEVTAAVGSSRLENLVAKTSFADLVSILANSRLAVGPDSGPGHIAAGCGVPYVALFGATSPEKTAPLGDQVRVVRSAIGCSPCYRRTCPGLNKLCMRLVSPEIVYQSVREALFTKTRAAR